MANRSESGKGLSVRQLTLIFLGGVGLCGLFFALGYLVGTNHRPADSTLATEQVAPPGEIPPTVNPPAQSSNTAPVPPDRPAQDSVVEQNLNSTAGANSAPAALPATAAAHPRAAVEGRRAQSERAAAAESPKGKGLEVQVSATHARQEAAALVRKLKSEGYSAALVTPEEAGTHDHIYRVQVGPYATRGQAMRVVERLGRAGFQPFIKE